MSHRFNKGDLVKHVKSMGIYRILECPDVVRIEATGGPGYLYRAELLFQPAIQWVRSQTEMEDGRFELLGKR